MAKSPIKPNSIRHRVLNHLADVSTADTEGLYKLFEEELADTLTTQQAFEDGHMRILHMDNYVTRVDDTLWGLTEDGIKKWREMRSAGPKFIGVPALPNTIHIGTGFYNGAELRDNCMRPGAYDAYRLPSLVGSNRQYPERK